MIIRRVTTQKEIYEILTECGDSFYDQSYNEETAIKKLADKFYHYANFVTAFIDGKKAGFIAYYSNNQETKTAFVSMIIIKKEFAGNGIGTKLLKFACNDSAQKGMERMGLEVDCHNTRAIEFYLKNDFCKKDSITTRSLYYEKKLTMERAK